MPIDSGPVPGDARSSIPQELVIDYENIVTEDDTPVDNLISEKQQRLLTDALYNSWSPNRPFVAMANVGLFFAIKQPPYVPDVLLSLDVHAPKDMAPKPNRSYFVWEYGKPPNVVIEVVSNKVGGEDTNKLADYAKIGIAHYAIFDPFHELGDQTLRVFEISGRGYQPMVPTGEGTFWMPSVGLGLTLWEGEYEEMQAEWLRWTDATGSIIPTGGEAMKIEQRRADNEKQRADAEKQRADQSEQLIDAERERTERLATKLRELGIDPSTLQ